MIYIKIHMYCICGIMSVDNTQMCLLLKKINVYVNLHKETAYCKVKVFVQTYQ